MSRARPAPSSTRRRPSPPRSSSPITTRSWSAPRRVTGGCPGRWPIFSTRPARSGCKASSTARSAAPFPRPRRSMAGRRRRFSASSPICSIWGWWWSACPTVHRACCAWMRSPAERPTASPRLPAARVNASPAPTSSSWRASRAATSPRSPAPCCAAAADRTGAHTMDGQFLSTIRPVAKLARGTPASDGAGGKLNRLIGTPQLQDVDPFLMLDEFRSDDAADYLAGFPDHPHRGFETVTYMLAGRMRHSDNKGHSGRLEAGSVQWMTAGRGIIHSEMPEQENGLMQGFQLWVNLPAKDKMVAPRYQEIPPQDIPVAELDGGIKVKVIAGAIGGVRGPIHGIATEPVLLDVALPAGRRFALPLPAGHSVFLYPFAGEVAVGDAATPLPRGSIPVLRPGGSVAITAPAGDARVLLAARPPLNEP